MELTWDIAPGFVVAGYGIRYYSLIFVVVIMTSWSLFRWQVTRGGGSDADADGFLIVGILATWLGGRLFHLLFYDLDAWMADPVMLLNPRRGGIASHGSGLALVITMWVFTRFKRTSFVDGLDRFMFPAAVATTLVRLGNFFNSEVVGRLTDQSWGVRFPRYDRAAELAPLRHPSQLYEFALGLLVLVLLFVVDRKLRETRPVGLLTALFFSVYFSGRFFVEYFKEYQVVSDSYLTMGQLLSLIPALAGYLGLYFALRTRKRAGWRSTTNGDVAVE